ncbi:acyltransferase family protein [Enterobacter pseudoroggenkampii]|jgi:peptidoglycan/LPS O-acetylase OafA/YrhL|uniref:Acyltransferase n=1 Tax=Enterobacter pseudoroggenkampii TaxID=2996112 RepID=A0ABT3XIC7_9ENTR|nr:acyltransferase [Enterobacter pseudoroggenkampii]MCX8303454.1 acyltransferase [Enterobacter pseudoroggenkampii]
MLNKHIFSLTSLRFFAAVGVFLHHLGVLNSVDNPIIKSFARYFFSGYAGVTFFYILSGFIISYSFRKHKADGYFDSKDFIFFRVVRIFPVHWLTLLFSFFVFSHFSNFDFLHIIALIFNFFLLHAFIPLEDVYFSFNPVSWSLSCELFFYCGFVFLVVLKTRFLLILLAMILVLQFYFLIHPQDLVSDHWLFYINPFFRINGFIIGMLLCRMHVSKMPVLSESMFSFMEILSVILLGLTLYLSTNFISDMNLRYDLLFIPAMAFMVFVFSYDGGVISKLLSHRCFVLLGEASFSFYMIHLIVIRVIFKITNDNHADDILAIMLTALTAFILSVLGSVIIFKLFEVPVNKALRNRWLKFRYKK